MPSLLHFRYGTAFGPEDHGHCHRILLDGHFIPLTGDFSDWIRTRVWSDEFQLNFTPLAQFIKGLRTNTQSPCLGIDLAAFVLYDFKTVPVDVALMASWPESTFRSRLKAVYWIDDPQDFSDLELDCYDVEIPAVPVPPKERGKSTTYKYAIALADFAAADRIRWECIRTYYSWEVAQAELGRIYGISQATVSRYIDALTTIKGGIDYEYF